jgi:hypothetical protein
MTRTYISILATLSMILSVSLLAAVESQTDASFKQKTAEADLIVVGRVTGEESKWSEPKKNIYTYAYISIEEYIKGFSLDKDITIRCLGGTVGDIVSAVPGMASFEKGERVVVFLIRDLRSDNFFVVRGMYGKYKIREDNTVASIEVSLPEFLDEIRRYIPE